MSLWYEETFQASYGEITPQGYPRLAVILSWLQEAALGHSHTRGFSVDDIKSKGITWVLSRITVQFERMPVADEQILVRTWPVTRESRSGIRDFELYDQCGKRVATATSLWVLLNLATRRPVKINEYLPEYPLNPVRALDDPFDPLPALGEDTPLTVQIPVLRSHIDQNAHVNNTVYATLALEVVPDSVIDTAVLDKIEIGFRAEAAYGDRISVAGTLAAEGGGWRVVHRLSASPDGRELTRVVTHWTVMPTIAHAVQKMVAPSVCV